MRVEPPNSNHRNKSRMASLRHRFSSVLAEDSSTRVLLTIVREKVGLDDITLRASAPFSRCCWRFFQGRPSNPGAAITSIPSPRISFPRMPLSLAPTIRNTRP